jgi:protoheme IX farnesyltransferase
MYNTVNEPIPTYTEAETKETFMSLSVTRPHLSDYFSLTKPSIMLLVVFTGAAALCVEGSLLTQPVKFILVLLALFLTGGSANAFNQYFERAVDAKMSRTSGRRVLPQKKITPTQALVFSIAIGIAGIAIFVIYFNWLSAVLSLGTILFYSFFYTLFLKPNTPQNIVIGGAAGAMPTIGAWAAATGDVTLAPLLLFCIVFFWTPPHFWALALYFKDDYKKSGLPMMPIVKGDDKTLTQIFYYTLVVVAVSMSLIVLNVGFIYIASAVVLGALFIKKAYTTRKLKTPESMRGLFGFSIIYLLVLFTAIIVDALVRRMV